MTDNGKDVSFPVGHVNYLSPEKCFSYATGHDHNSSCLSVKCDVWSLGVICLEMCLVSACCFLFYHSQFESVIQMTLML